MKNFLGRLGIFYKDMPRQTRIMAVLALVLVIISIALNGVDWGEVLQFCLGAVGIFVAVLVIGFVTLGLSKIVGEKAATFIVMILVLGALGGCVGYVLSNWGY